MGERHLEIFVTCMSRHLYWILQHMYLCDNTFAVCVLLRWETGLWMGPDGGCWLVKGPSTTLFSSHLSHCHWSELLLFP